MSTDSTDPADKTVVKKSAARSAAPSKSGGDPDGPTDLNLSPGVIIAICAGLVLLVVIVFALSGGDDGDDGNASDTTVEVGNGNANGNGNGNGNGSPPSPPKPPAEPKTPKGSPEGAPTDDFERADGPVGEPWVPIGEWVVDDGQIRLAETLEGFKQVAVRDLGASDGTVSAVATSPSAGAGLLFRYTNPENYWRLSPVRSYASWALFKVVDGKSTLVANTGLSPTNVNTTATVTFSGPTITVTIDGKERVTVEDPAHQGATLVGFLAGGSRADRAMWDDFYALPAGEAVTATTAPAG